jgi:hypothetical protein
MVGKIDFGIAVSFTDEATDGGKRDLRNQGKTAVCQKKKERQSSGIGDELISLVKYWIRSPILADVVIGLSELLFVVIGLYQNYVTMRKGLSTSDIRRRKSLPGLRGMP